MAEVQLKDELTRIETMTNVELRAELKKRGCSTTGIKKDLLVKLRVALQKEYEERSSSNAEKFIVQNLRSSTNSSISEQDLSSMDNSQTNENLTLEKTISEDLQTKNVEQIDLENSANNNNIEVISFVSKSNEENEIDREKLGEREELDSLSVGSSYAKSESIIKEIPLSNEQQRLNSSNSEQTMTNNEEINLATNLENDDLKNKNIETTVDSKPDPTVSQENIKDEEKSISFDKAVSQQQLKSSRSQTSSSIKILNRSTSNKINLNLEILKTIVPDLNLLSESTVDAEFESLLYDQNIEQSSNEPILETNVENNVFLSDSMTIGELADQKQQTNRTVVMNVSEEDSSLKDDSLGRKKQTLTTNRTPSFESKTLLDGKSSTIVTDEPIRIKNVTETNEPLSKILYINGLTRPFSLLQLKGLLSRYGTLVDGEFSLDKIKSQCFVTYETLEDAQNAREALDGCRWPLTNPKTLSVRFSQHNEFEFSKTHDLPPDQMSKASTDRIAHENVTTSRRSPSPIVETKLNMKKIRSDPNQSERQKIQDENKEIQNESFDNDENEPVKSNETPAKGLDDYFRKTKTKPSIYWLPLTEEKIVERKLRQQQRNAEREEEQKKRELNEKVRQTDAKSKRRTPSPREKRKHKSTSPKRDSKRH